MGKKSRSKRQKQGSATNIIQVPPEIAVAIDKASSDDRAWFEVHPDADRRTRPAFPGEFWPVFDSASVLYVIVSQVWPGFRLRLPVVRLHLPGTEKIQ